MNFHFKKLLALLLALVLTLGLALPAGALEDRGEETAPEAPAEEATYALTDLVRVSI